MLGNPSTCREELENFDAFDEGVFCRSRFWLFISYVVSFASVIAAVWVLLQGYALSEAPSVWPGVAGLFQASPPLCCCQLGCDGNVTASLCRCQLGCDGDVTASSTISVKCDLECFAPLWDCRSSSYWVRHWCFSLHGRRPKGAADMTMAVSELIIHQKCNCTASLLLGRVCVPHIAAAIAL